MTPADAHRAALIARREALAQKRRPIPHWLTEAIRQSTLAALAMKPRVRVKAGRTG